MGMDFARKMLGQRATERLRLPRRPLLCDSIARTRHNTSIAMLESSAEFIDRCVIELATAAMTAKRAMPGSSG
jgi:hypothetical protein